MEVLLPARHLLSSRSKPRNGDTLKMPEEEMTKLPVGLISGLLIGQMAMEILFPGRHLPAAGQGREMVTPKDAGGRDDKRPNWCILPIVSPISAS